MIFFSSIQAMENFFISYKNNVIHMNIVFEIEPFVTKTMRFMNKGT